MNQEQTLVDALIDRLVDLVEPNTRFDLSSLPLIESEACCVSVVGTQKYAVSFGAERQSGRGRLPATVRKVRSSQELEAFIDAQTKANERDLEPRLSSWLTGQNELPGSPLAPAMCYGGSESAGHEYDCSPCSGAGKTSCVQCRGVGKTSCWSCHGTGMVSCSSCGGKGNISCSNCGGRGQVGEHRERRRTNTADNTSWTESYLEYVSCFSCSGRGTQKCSCSDGEIPCSTCTRGKITCMACGGNGKVNCKNCDATGVLNGSATLSCSVSQLLSLEADVAAEEPKRVIESLPTLESLCALTRVESTGSSVGSSSVSRKLAARMWLTAVRVRAAEEEVQLFGYGDNAVVKDFKNIVGALLKSDLEEVEQALARSPRLPLRPVAALDKALAQFLLSEINEKIGRVGGGGKDALDKFAREALSDAVSSDYVRRAAKAVRSSVTRTFTSEMVLPIVGVGFVASVTYVLLPMMNLLTQNEAFWTAWLLAIVGGGLAEYSGLVRLKQRFPHQLSSKAVSLLRATHTLWICRAAVLASSWIWIIALAVLVQSYYQFAMVGS